MSADGGPGQSDRGVVVQGLQVGDHNDQVNQFQFIDTYIDNRSGSLGPVVRSAYLEQVKRIAPSELLDRAAELAELAAFCTESGQGPYVWWRASAWAGKSALMSWFVLHPPPGVQIVSFFVTARWKGHDDRDAFISAMLEQLAELLEEPIPAYLNETTREPHLLSMITRTAEKFARQGRRLVLVVDGLDEDRGVTIGPDAHSIAELLPTRPSAGMRVIVTGRPDPPVPADVPDDHPLRAPGVVRTLAASRRAAVVRSDMQRELKRLLVGSVTEQDLLGLVTAAGGGLSAADLAHLTGLSAYDVQENLDAVAGRTFMARASQWKPTGPARYVLGHEELQAAAARSLGLERLTGYRQRLYAWADEYRRQGWPADAPEYLLRGYPRLLQDVGDITRLMACATDQARHDRMLDITGGDTAALTEIIEAQRLLLRQEEPDLPALARLNVHRNLIAERNAYVPVILPAVWAAIGHQDRGEALARAITDPAPRARALADLARTVIDAGHPKRAKTLASLVLAATQAIGDPIQRRRMLGELAWTPVDAGHSESANVLADLLLAATQAITDPVEQAETREGLARAARQAGDLDRATAAAQVIADPVLQARALADLAQAAARAGDLGRARAAAQAIISRTARAQALAELAQTAADAGNPAQAGLLAGHALDAAQAITNTVLQARLLANLARVAERAGDLDRAIAAAQAITSREDRAQALAELAQTAADAGDVRRARLLTSRSLDAARAVTDHGLRALTIGKLTRAAAKAGDPTQARMLADEALDAARPIINPYRQAQVLADLAWEVGAAGAMDRAGVAARTISDPGHQARVLAGLAGAAADAGALEQAGLLNGQALDAALAIADPDQRAPVLAGLARAAAKAGDPNRALTTAQAITDIGLQAQVLAELARAAADASDPRRARLLTGLALPVALSIVDPGLQAQVLARLARAAAKAGNDEQADTAAEAITKLGLRAQVLAELTQTAADAGNLRRASLLTGLALTAAHAVVRPGQRTRVLTDVARTAARTGGMDRALATAQEIADPQLWAQILTDVTRRAAQAGDPNRALAAAQEIADPRLRAQVLAELARNAADAGDLDQAIVITNHALDAHRAAGERFDARYTLAGLARTAAKTGDPDLVTAAVQAITDPDFRAGILVELAQAAAGAGNPEQTRMLTDQAMEAARAITAPSDRNLTIGGGRDVQVRTEVARMAAKAGDLERAKIMVDETLTIARTITNPDQRAQLLAAVARTAADAGDFDLAETAAQEINIPFWQPQLLAELARAAKETGDPEQARMLASKALTTAQVISDPVRHAHMLHKLARIVDRAGFPERAQKLVDLAPAAAPAQTGETQAAKEQAAPPGPTRQRPIDDMDGQMMTLAEMAGQAEPSHSAAVLAEALTAGHWLASIDVLEKISPAAVIAIADEYLNVPTSAGNFQWTNPPYMTLDNRLRSINDPGDTTARTDAARAGFPRESI